MELRDGLMPKFDYEEWQARKGNKEKEEKRDYNMVVETLSKGKESSINQ